MSRGHILIVDEHYESDQQISFLLRLGGFKITLARSCGEGINWLTSLREESSCFDLVLIRNVAKTTDLIALCDVSNRLVDVLGVLLVEHHDLLTNTIADVCDDSCGRIDSCRSEEIMGKVRQFFKQKTMKNIDEKLPLAAVELDKT